MFEDPFEKIATIQTQAYDEGFAEGEFTGKKTAFLQGLKTGQKVAFDIVCELGQYYGHCAIYLRQNQDIENERNVKLASQICELLEKFDFVDCHNEKFPGSLALIRDKYTKFCSLTNTKNYFSKNSTNAATSKLSF